MKARANLSIVQRAMIRRRLQEFIRYDGGLLRAPLARAGFMAGTLLWRLGHIESGLRTLTRTHSSAFSDNISARITTRLRTEIQRAKRGEARGLPEALRQYADNYGRDGTIPPALQDPRRLLGSRILVLKTPRNRERGVVLLDYSYVFPLFARLFDVESIAARYHIVLEPSWCGLCSLDLLCYTRYDFPIFVESGEPRDTEFLLRLESNLVPVPVAGNWWVDHRAMRPDPEVQKDTDVVMVAAWASFKRHWRFFRALRQLRQQGERLKVMLIGYPADRTREDIANDARLFGVLDQLEFHEWLPVEQVGRILARSKAHLLWSRKEGFNRAIIEAMLCNLPVIMREGFNFGYRQPYINPATGVYANEDNLVEHLVRLVRNHERFSPRAWVLEHMTCQKATEVLEGRIRETALALGEHWTEGLAVKTVALNTQDYWNPEDRKRFEPDYAFLETQIRR